MKLTLENLKKAGACKDGYNWVKEYKGNDVWNDMCIDWFFWCAGKGFDVPEERLDWCAKEWPNDALEYASELLTPDRLDKCAEKRPDYALQFASALLNPDRLDWCAEKRPKLALEYASGLLKPDRLAWCRNEVKK